MKGRVLTERDHTHTRNIDLSELVLMLSIDGTHGNIPYSSFFFFLDDEKSTYDWGWMKFERELLKIQKESLRGKALPLCTLGFLSYSFSGSIRAELSSGTRLNSIKELCSWTLYNSVSSCFTRVNWEYSFLLILVLFHWSILMPPLLSCSSTPYESGGELTLVHWSLEVYSCQHFSYR